MEPTTQLHQGDCRDILKTLPDNSIDSVVTDPPYELGFMGKKWDNTGIAYDTSMWAEVLRVLKPGGHLLAFGGTRTYHRMVVAIEDAGFEIRDSIHWIYGSGFPKSLDVSKAIDKTNGEPDRLHKFTAWMRTTGLNRSKCSELVRPFAKNDETAAAMAQHYYSDKQQPAIPTAAIWQVIRPHIADVPDWVDKLVARIEAEREVVGKAKGTYPVDHINASNFAQGAQGRVQLDITVPATDAAKQWEGWGTALKPAHEPIVVARKPLNGTVAANVFQYGTGALNIDACRIGDPPGRWPANVIHDGSDEVTAMFPDDTHRFFYAAKATRAERNAENTTTNNHPTVKPITLIRYLLRLVTPPNGTTLDPFAGSGTTLAAAIHENLHAIGIELTPEYHPIIQARIQHAQATRKPIQ
jgi:DNA modification methylase